MTVIKGSKSQENLKNTVSGFTDKGRDGHRFLTIQDIGGKYLNGANVIGGGVWDVTAGVPDTVEASSTTRVLIATAHDAKAGDIIAFESGALQYTLVPVLEVTTNEILLGGVLESSPVGLTFSILRGVLQKLGSDGGISISTAGLATDTEQTAQGLTLDAIETEQLAQGLTLDAIETAVEKTLTPVDFLDSGEVTGVTIPRSSNNATVIVANLAANVKKIQVIEDIGAMMAIYSDAARTSLICYLPLAGGDIEVSISSGVAIYIGAVKDADITVGTSSLIMNLLG